MDGKDKLIDYTISLHSGAEVMLERFGELTKNSDIVTERSRKFLEAYSKRFTEMMSSLYNISNDNVFENLQKNYKVFSDGLLLVYLEKMGEAGWCNVDEWIRSEDDRRQNPLAYYFVERVKNYDEIDIEDLDSNVGKYFTKEIVFNIEEKTASLLSEKDAEKLRVAMDDYRGKRYMHAAIILAGLIDAQNIKQELFDKNNNKYIVENCDKNNGPNISQGWRAFHIVFSNNFSVYFGGAKFNGKSGEDKEKGFNKFIDSIRGKVPNDNSLISIVALSFCLFNLFDNSSFSNYPNSIPASLNRNWLMHGMYDVGDITKYDCIKLLLMVYQTSKLYKRLKDGEL